MSVPVPDEALNQARARLREAFTPYSPIDDVQLFRGRLAQLRAAVETISTRGQHAVMHGERGVGKTSLANILKDTLETVFGSVKVNCGAEDTFEDVLRRSLQSLEFSVRERGAGFEAEEREVVYSVAQMLPSGGRVSPDAVAEILHRLPPYVLLVFDEFDRLKRSAKVSMADMIKALSDRGSSTTIILVGVGTDIDELIANHASVERCLRQIPLQRMSDDEIMEILHKGFETSGFTAESGAVHSRIVAVSQGFPHYAHLLGRNAAQAALNDARLHISPSDVVVGMHRAVEDTDHSLRDLYHRAVTGTRKAHLWKEVVTACALAESDERGMFPTRAVQDAASRIVGRQVVQQTVAFHLGKLIEPARGPLLERTGTERRYRYRFMNPLLRPFILMKATADGLIDHSLVVNGVA